MADFTPEQLEAVEAAMKNHCSYFYEKTDTWADNEVNRVITELQKHPWVPKVGQVYAFVDDCRTDWAFIRCSDIPEPTKNVKRRPITATEIGLERFNHYDESNDEEYVLIDWLAGYNKAIDHVNNKLFGDTE